MADGGSIGTAGGGTWTSAILRAALYAALVLFAFYYLLPLFVMLSTSVNTGEFASTRSFTMSSMRRISSVVTGRLQVKSKRSRSGATTDPFWVA